MSYSRQYEAMGVSEQVDALIRVWRDASIRIGMYAVITQSEMDGVYRIDNVQHGINEDGLKITDLTLGRMEETYGVVAE